MTVAARFLDLFTMDSIFSYNSVFSSLFCVISAYVQVASAHCSARHLRKCGI